MCMRLTEKEDHIAIDAITRKCIGGLSIDVILEVAQAQKCKDAPLAASSRKQQPRDGERAL